MFNSYIKNTYFHIYDIHNIYNKSIDIKIVKTKNTTKTDFFKFQGILFLYSDAGNLYQEIGFTNPLPRPTILIDCNLLFNEDTLNNEKMLENLFKFISDFYTTRDYSVSNEKISTVFNDYTCLKNINEITNSNYSKLELYHNYIYIFSYGINNSNELMNKSKSFPKEIKDKMESALSVFNKNFNNFKNTLDKFQSEIE